MGKHSAPAPRWTSQVLSAATIALSVVGLGTALALPAEAATAPKKLSGPKAPKKIDEPGSTQDAVRLPDVAGVTWKVSARPDATDDPATSPTCANASTQAADKFCNVSAKDLDAIRVKAVLADGSTQIFPTLYFKKAKGVLKLTGATSPRAVDRPGYLDDGLTLPTVKGVTWKVGSTTVDLSALKGGFYPTGATGPTPSVTVTAVVNEEDYLVADDSYGLQWKLAFNVAVNDADVQAPGVLDLGGIKADAVVVAHTANATWYVDGRRLGTKAGRTAQTGTKGKPAVVLAIPAPGYKMPANPAIHDPSLSACAPITDLTTVKGSKPGSLAWTCSATSTPQTISAAAFTGKAPTVGRDLGGTKNDSITLHAVPGVKWQVTTPAGVRTHAVTAGTKTVALNYAAKSFGDNYPVTVKPVVAVAADYSFAPGADADTPLTFTSKLSVVGVAGKVKQVAGIPQSVEITGVQGVNSWKIRSAGKTTTARVKAGDVHRFRTASAADAQVTPVFDYGYGESTTSAVGTPITPAP
ncbi:hypothetical protein [Gephyromycinifex aptenodytis]|uniref:hypothetical protein n=1 Tax=Gephyromycinifex aptenodytis TaxID=2716227 RepID=UPI0014469838|nr:hypothetical protein [Gephyromycinifex aptenodytis]